MEGRVLALGFRVWGVGFSFRGLGFRVWGFRVFFGLFGVEG